MEHSKQLSKKQTGKQRKNMKAAHEILETLPARRSDHLPTNDIEERMGDNSLTLLLRLSFCGYCWPENSKALSPFLERKGKLEIFLWKCKDKQFLT